MGDEENVIEGEGKWCGGRHGASGRGRELGRMNGIIEGVE